MVNLLQLSSKLILTTEKGVLIFKVNQSNCMGNTARTMDRLFRNRNYFILGFYSRCTFQKFPHTKDQNGALVQRARCQAKLNWYMHIFGTAVHVFNKRLSLLS